VAVAAQKLGATGIWQQGRICLTCGTTPLLAKAKCNSRKHPEDYIQPNSQWLDMEDLEVCPSQLFC